MHMDEFMASDAAQETQENSQHSGGEAQGSPREAYERCAEHLVESINVDADLFNTRNSTAFPTSSAKFKPVCLVGAGGLGNWQWRALLGMGFENLAIFDDDVVGPENVGPQSHDMADIGIPKVSAIATKAMLYRGVKIRAMNLKAEESYYGLIGQLGYVPEILIGCTDSADWRNAMIRSLRTSLHDGFVDMQLTDYPEIFLDFRMSMGNWRCYAIPIRSIARQMKEIRYSTDSRSVAFDYLERTYASKYELEAVFPPDKALQEPCTERAICYTGAAAAAFTGAFLHWWYTKGSDELRDSGKLATYFSFDDDPHMKFRYRTSFSTQEWDPIDPTDMSRHLNARLLKNDMHASMLQVMIDSLANDFNVNVDSVSRDFSETGPYDGIVSRGDTTIESIGRQLVGIRSDGIGAVCVSPESGATFIYPVGGEGSARIRGTALRSTENSTIDRAYAVMDTDAVRMEGNQAFAIVDVRDVALNPETATVFEWYFLAHRELPLPDEYKDVTLRLYACGVEWKVSAWTHSGIESVQPHTLLFEVGTSGTYMVIYPFQKVSRYVDFVVSMLGSIRNTAMALGYVHPGDMAATQESTAAVGSDAEARETGRCLTVKDLRYGDWGEFIEDGLAGKLFMYLAETRRTAGGAEMLCKVRMPDDDDDDSVDMWINGNTLCRLAENFERAVGADDDDDEEDQ